MMNSSNHKETKIIMQPKNYGKPFMI